MILPGKTPGRQSSNDVGQFILSMPTLLGPIELRRRATNAREHLCDLLARDLGVWSASISWSQSAGILESIPVLLRDLP